MIRGSHPLPLLVDKDRECMDGATELWRRLQTTPQFCRPLPRCKSMWISLYPICTTIERSYRLRLLRFSLLRLRFLSRERLLRRSRDFDLLLFRSRDFDREGLLRRRGDLLFRRTVGEGVRRRRRGERERDLPAEQQRIDRNYNDRNVSK